MKDLETTRETWPKDIDHTIQVIENLDKIIQLSKNGELDDRWIALGTNYVLKLCQLDAKYAALSGKIQTDIRSFIKLSLMGTLNNHLAHNSLIKHDIDKNGKADSVEESIYTQKMTGAILQIIKLWGIEKFSQAHYAARNETNSWDFDKKVAAYTNFSKHLMGEKGDKNFAEWLIQKSLWMTEEAWKELMEKKFDITSSQSYWELALLLAKDFWSGVEDILRFIGTLPSALILLPRYTRLRKDIITGNAEAQVRAEIEKEVLVEQYPALGLPELLWEKGIEAIKHIWNLFTSGKVWDISQAIMMLAGLVAGAAWVSRLASVLARRSAIKSARQAGGIARQAGETSTREVRNAMRAVGKMSGTVEQVAGRIDSIVSGGALIGWIGWRQVKEWQRSTITEGRLRDRKSAEELNRTITETAQRKWISENQARIEKIGEDFPKLQPYLEKIGEYLIGIHAINTGSEVVWKYGVHSLGQKMKQTTQLLEWAGMSHTEARALTKEMIKKWYLWDINEAFAQIERKWRDIRDFLDTLGGKIVNEELLLLIYKKLPEVFSTKEGLRDFLDAYELVIGKDFDMLYEQALNMWKSGKLTEFKSGKWVSYEWLKVFKKADGSFEDIGTVHTLFEHGEPTDIQQFIETEVLNRTDGRNFADIIKGDERVIESLLQQKPADTVSKIIWALEGSTNWALSNKIIEQIVEKIKQLQNSGIYAENLAKSKIARFEAKMQSISTEKMIDIFLQWEWNKDEYIHLLSDNNSMRTEWNRQFSVAADTADYRKCIQMIRRWELSFFSATQRTRILDILWENALALQILKPLFDVGQPYAELYNEARWNIQAIIFPERFWR